MTIDAIRNRRSVREYKSDQVRDEDITEIIKAAQFGPTAHNNQAIEFVVVREQATKDEIYGITGSDETQRFVSHAPVLLVMVTDKEKTPMPIEDLSAASENVFLEAVSRGLGSVWKHITAEQDPQIKELLGIPGNFTLINVIPIGYAASAPEPKSDYDFQPEKIHQEKW
jgi:nitroreductase